MDQRSALDDAYRATSMLYQSENPLTTHMWCIGKVESSENRDHVIVYKPVDRQRAQIIANTLGEYVKTLNVQSPEYFVESDYFDKIDVFRNWYEPESLHQQADVCPWFLRGSDIPKPMTDRLASWWGRVVPKDYRVLSPFQIKCPKFEASAGVSLVGQPGGDVEWEYLQKGPNWSRIQEGTLRWLEIVADAVPDSWLRRPVRNIWKWQNSLLELLAIERPVIRKESGPGKVRWARSSSGNVYILGRMFAQEIQKGSLWSNSPNYIGKASNTTYGAIKASNLSEGDEPYIGTHGDDFIIYCPKCHMWHSGDWSNFDLHVSATQLAASYHEWYACIQHLLTRTQQKWFYAMAYLGIKCPTIWLWGREKKGNEWVVVPKMGIHQTLGKVRSGSGEFILNNNALNSALLSWNFDQTHRRLESVARPCKSKRWWPWFAEGADLQGWCCKPSAQFSHPNGFIACRCIHRESKSFLPVPSICSVIRNYINPAYDPEEYPNSARDLLVVRFRELNKTLAWAPSAWADKMMDVIVDVHEAAGVADPNGSEFSDAELSRAITRVVDLYSTQAYLEGNAGKED